MSRLGSGHRLVVRYGQKYGLVPVFKKIIRRVLSYGNKKGGYDYCPSVRLSVCHTAVETAKHIIKLFTIGQPQF